MGSQQPVIAVAVDAGRRDQPGQLLQELEGREDERGAALEVGVSEAVEEACVRRGQRVLSPRGVEPLQREGPRARSTAPAARVRRGPAPPRARSRPR
jgi:hypothetical protein